tara:strand:+ start:1684 stop:1818 length:135 start_codon:yes stop_codon:yes gene_type:complete
MGVERVQWNQILNPMPLLLIPAAFAVTYATWIIIKYDPNSRFNL